MFETRTGRMEEETKRDKGRCIDFSDAESLEAYHERQRYEAEITRGCEDHGLVFLYFRGTARPIRRTYTYRSFKPLLRGAGLPNIVFHDLRHTCATILLMVGKHPKFVQEMFEHANISIRLDTYSCVIVGIDGGLADAMDDAL